MSAEHEGETDDLAAVEARMRRLGERVRAKLEQEGGGLVEERTERALEDSIRRALAEEQRRAAQKRAAWIALGAAAALVAWLAFLQLPRQPARPEVPLGPPRIELLRPIGDVPDFTEFEWRVDELPPGAEVRLRLFDAANPDTPIREIERDEPRWIPTDDERSRLPDDLHWQIVILDSLGDVFDSRDARASRLAKH